MTLLYKNQILIFPESYYDQLGLVLHATEKLYEHFLVPYKSVLKTASFPNENLRSIVFEKKMTCVEQKIERRWKSEKFTMAIYQYL